MRTGKAEIGEYVIAHELGHKAVVAGGDAQAVVLIDADDPPHVLGLEPRQARGRADEIAKRSTNRSFVELFGVVIRSLVPLPSASTAKLGHQGCHPDSWQPTHTSSKIRVARRTSLSEEGPAENRGIWVRIGSAIKGR
jgi:hypothetical protein